jgi:hypothetical protein
LHIDAPQYGYDSHNTNGTWNDCCAVQYANKLQNFGQTIVVQRAKDTLTMEGISPNTRLDQCTNNTQTIGIIFTDNCLSIDANNSHSMGRRNSDNSGCEIENCMTVVIHDTQAICKCELLVGL